MLCWIDLISCIIFMHYNLATKIRFAHDVNPLNTIVIIIINIKQYGIKHSSMVMTNPRKKQHHNSSIGFIKLLELPCCFFCPATDEPSSRPRWTSPTSRSMGMRRTGRAGDADKIRWFFPWVLQNRWF